EHEIVRMGREHARGVDILADDLAGAFRWNAGATVGLDDVDAERDRQRHFFKPRSDCPRAVVRYAVSDGDGAVLGQEKEPRARVAIRRIRRDGTYLHMAEAEPGERLDRLAALVEARGQANRILEMHARDFDVQARLAAPAKRPQRGCGKACERACAKRQSM